MMDLDTRVRALALPHGLSDVQAIVFDHGPQVGVMACWPDVRKAFLRPFTTPQPTDELLNAMLADLAAWKRERDA